MGYLNKPSWGDNFFQLFNLCSESYDKLNLEKASVKVIDVTPAREEQISLHSKYAGFFPSVCLSVCLIFCLFFVHSITPKAMTECPQNFQRIPISNSVKFCGQNLNSTSYLRAIYITAKNR